MEKNKSKIIENVKTEAKEYYNGKNMTIRYVILGFLVILIVIQFILPHKKNKKELVENIVENPGEIDEIDEEEPIFNFLGEDLILSEMDSNTKIQFDKILKKIQNDLDYKYTFSQYYLPEIYEILNKYDVPVEFAHIAILNDFQQPYWEMEKDFREYYGLTISSEIDETLNVKKVTEATALYFLDLYKEFKDRNLVLIAYFMGPDELAQEMDTQGVKSFDDLYITNDIKDKYLQIMAYSYVFQHLDAFIDVNKLSFYEPKDTKTITLSETKDLVKRAKKNKQSYKDIKELNPRILGNSLPKGKREIIIKN